MPPETFTQWEDCMADADLSPIYSDGESYERFNGKWSRISGRDFIGWLSVPNGRRWLDVGCGTGALCEVILGHCTPDEYVGVDVAEAQLAYARSRHADANARFQRDDALALSFHENEFDAAVSAYVINFFPEPRKMVAEMKRVVRPSGTVAACTWDFAGNRPVAQHIAAAMAARSSTALKHVANVQHADSTRPEAMEQIFRDVGLKDVTTISIDTLVSYRDFDDYWISNTDFSSILSNLVNELTAQDREQFKAEVKALVPISADGSIRYNVGTIAAKGVVPNR
jgi:ubiquinone/menaquinone biosynthesis C-methylase UbiE